MRSSSKHALIAEVKRILSLRRIMDTIPCLANHNSNGRTEKLNELSEDELKNLLNVLNHFSESVFITGIYSIAKEVGCIKSEVVSADNEELILNYLKQNGIISEYNQLLVMDKKTLKVESSLLISAPFSHLSWLALYLISDALSKVFLQRASQMN